MKKVFHKLISTSLLLALFLFSFLFVNLNQIKPVYAATCGLGSSSVVAGNNLGFGYGGFNAGQKIFIWDGGSNRFDLGTTLTGDQLVSFNVPSTAPPGNYGGFIENAPSASVSCGRVTITAAGGGGGGSGSLGTINPPAGVPNPVNAGDYIAGVIKNGISILIIVSFLAFFLWTIFAGFRFITAGGDEKAVSSAWSSIYWGIIGMIVVLSSYALVVLVEKFFGVDIITGGLRLPV